jgi:hypothetical protein
MEQKKSILAVGSVVLGISGSAIAIIKFIGMSFAFVFGFLLELFVPLTPPKAMFLGNATFELTLGLAAVITSAVALVIIKRHKKTMHGRKLARRGRNLGLFIIGLSILNQLFFATLYQP